MKPKRLHPGSDFAQFRFDRRIFRGNYSYQGLNFLYNFGEYSYQVPDYLYQDQAFFLLPSVFYKFAAFFKEI
jgi:hypothetical protein